MGFVNDFRPASGQMPLQANQAPRQRGFFSDFKGETIETPVLPPTEAFEPTPQAEESSTPYRPTRSWDRAPAPEPEAASPKTRNWWDASSSAPEVKKPGNDFEAGRIKSEISNLTGRLKSASSSRNQAENSASSLRQEYHRVEGELARAKAAVLTNRETYTRTEKWLERSKKIVSRMEMRMNGFDNGWGRGGGGGGRWAWRQSDFLFSRAELRGPENEDERKYQMGLELDQRRSKVWELQSKVSTARSDYLTSQAKVRELEYRLSQVRNELDQAKASQHKNSELKSNLESKISSLKNRYRQTAGKPWSGY